MWHVKETEDKILWTSGIKADEDKGKLVKYQWGTKKVLIVECQIKMGFHKADKMSRKDKKIYYDCRVWRKDEYIL